MWIEAEIVGLKRRIGTAPVGDGEHFIIRSYKFLFSGHMSPHLSSSRRSFLEEHSVFEAHNLSAFLHQIRLVD